MKGSTFARALAVIAAAGFVLSAAPARAQLDGDDAKCRATIAKNVSKYTSTLLKNAVGCHKSRLGGKVVAGTNCNNHTAADTKGKLGGARDKAEAAFGDTDSACTGRTAVLAQYGRCPSPSHASDDGGATTGIDTFDELATCLLNLAEAMVDRAGEEMFGNPTVGELKTRNKCHGAIAKNAAKVINTITKTRKGCQDDQDDIDTSPAHDDCADFDDGKIAGALAKLDGAIADSCGAVDDTDDTLKEELDTLGACGDTVAQLQECVGDIVASRTGGGVLSMAYELPSDCSGIDGVDVFINAGVGEQITDTVLSAGWTGLGHNVDVIDGFEGRVEVACDQDCRNCDVFIDHLKTEPQGACRCRNDPRVHCDSINLPDVGDCGSIGDNTCDCMFGPPLPLAAGGVATCVVNRIPTELDGDADLGTGQSTTTVKNNSLVHLGINQVQPCPVCEGDNVSNDGLRDGTCNGGPRNGGNCDGNAFHPQFNGDAYNPDSTQSYDCPPDPGSNFSGTGLELSLVLTSGTQTLAATLPCDSAGLCPCRVCSGNANVGCSSTAECTAIGAGTCTGGGGAGVFPHACNTACDGGFCDGDGPFDMFCDGLTRNNGDGYLTCNTNTDCTIPGSGNCSLASPRRCFEYPLSLTGDPGIFGGDLVTTFCIAPTSNPNINNAGGLPAAGELEVNFDFDGLCASDHNVAFVAPGGSNCP